jgi:cell shape-determining protein MreC
MKNLHRRSDKKSVRHLIVATVLVVVICAADVLSGGKLREGVRQAGAGVFTFLTNVKSSVFQSGAFSTRRSLIRKNEALKREIDALKLSVAGTAVLEAELAELRSMVRLAEEAPGITASVVSSLRASPYGTFLIGAGTSNGIGQGDLVTVGSGESNFVLGYVSEPGTRVSLVTEVFAPSAEVSAVAAGAEFLVRGRGDNGRAEVPASLDIAEGEPVASPAYGGRPLGIVGGIVEESGGASKELFIRFPVNLSEVQFVYVIPRQQ